MEVFMKEFYLQNAESINGLMVGLAIYLGHKICDYVIAKSKLKSSSLWQAISVGVVAIKKLLSKRVKK